MECHVTTRTGVRVLAWPRWPACAGALRVSSRYTCVTQRSCHIVIALSIRVLVCRGQVVEGADGFIGSGSLGEVRLGRWRGVEVALKSLRAINDTPGCLGYRF